METEIQKKKPTRRYILIGLLLLIAAIFGVNYWLSNRHLITTDNAQIDGDILSLRSGITGYVKSINVKDNQRIKKGDTLIIFKTEELLTSVKQAEATLQNAKATVKVSDMRALASTENANASVLASSSNEELITAAEANLNKAQLDFKRINKLLAIKAATQEQYESVYTKLEIAKAEYSKAIRIKQSSLSSSAGLKTQAKAEKSQITVAMALIQQREAELNQAKEHLSRAFVIAPFDGIFTKRSIQQGQFISAGQALGALIDNKKIWVIANFKETQLEKINIGQDVIIDIDAYPGVKLTGKVDSWGGATGAKFTIIPPDNATGNFIKIVQRFPVRISIGESKIENKVTAKLFPGLSVVAKVKIQ